MFMNDILPVRFIKEPFFRDRELYLFSLYKYKIRVYYVNRVNF